MGAQVSDEEIVKMMAEADQDHNMKLDIDEFVNLLTMGD
jgi:Ca2+-binding EF-hand superfamily protein